MNQNLPQELDRESLNQLSKEQLVEMIIEQNKVIRELQKIIYELHLEVERLKVSRDLDSKTSSKPPSGDILKKSENKKAPLEEEPNGSYAVLSDPVKNKRSLNYFLRNKRKIILFRAY